MFKISDLASKIHDAVMEPETVKKEDQPSTPTLGPCSVQVLSQPVPAYHQPNWQVSDSPNPLNNYLPPTPDLSTNDAIYQVLVQKTNFEDTEVGKQITDHLIRLDGLPLTDAQKMQAVLKAGAKEGLTVDKINNTYLELKTALETEVKKFNDSVIAPANNSLEAKKGTIEATANKIKELEAQINTQRDKQSKLSAEVINDQAAIEQKQATFSSAYSRRESELISAIRRINDTLKGIA